MQNMLFSVGGRLFTFRFNFANKRNKCIQINTRHTKTFNMFLTLKRINNLEQFEKHFHSSYNTRNLTFH